MEGGIRGFLFGNDFIWPTSEDVELVFGVRGGAVPVIPGGGTVMITDFLKRCFPAKIEHLMGNRPASHYRLSPSLCRLVLVKLVGQGDRVRGDDVARVLHLYLLATFFIPTQNVSLNWKFTELIDDFSRICEYDWCDYILDVLMEDIRTANQCRIGSCAIFLLVSSPQLS